MTRGLDPPLSDFGRIGGTSDWTHITGTWKSRANEHVIRIMLFGSPDFVGEAYFDDLILEEIDPEGVVSEKGVGQWEE